jgi:hypothetical protein
LAGRHEAIFYPGRFSIWQLTECVSDLKNLNGQHLSKILGLLSERPNFLCPVVKNLLSKLGKRGSRSTLTLMLTEN